jgi:hypothetical protein
MYIYERTTEQLIRWHKRASDMYWNDETDAAAFNMMDTIAQELEGRGLKAVFAADNSPVCTWIRKNQELVA